MPSRPAPEPASMGRLFRLIKDYVLRHRTLVVMVLLLGLANASLQKGPLLLVKGVVDTLFQTGDGAPAVELPKSGEAVYEGIEALKEDLLQLFRLGSWADPAAGPVERILGYLLILVLVTPIGALVLYFFRVLTNLVSTKVVVDLREQICAHILRLSLSFIHRQRTGDLISRVTNDTNQVRASFTLVLENVVAEPLLLLANVFLAWTVHPMRAVVVFLTIPVLILPIRRLGKRVRKTSGRSLEALGDSTDVMSEMFQGFRTVKAFRLETQEIAEFKRENDKFFQRTMKLVRARALSQALTFLIYMLGFGVILLVLANYSHEISPGTATMAMIPLATTYQHVKRLARSYNLIKESQGALDRVDEILDSKPEVLDSGSVAADALRGDIRFDHVSFGYGPTTVLEGLSFTVHAGEKVALVGASGAGKSTILDLVARFYDPLQGRVLVDERDLRDYELPSYLEQIAIVDQRPFLFNRSIRENILTGKPGASEEEVREAARVARVDEIVARLPHGFDTVVGERGAALSGGELQRITIARAVIRDPRILLLDEATNALDTESERKVQEALDALMQGRTSLIIAHRLSTVRDADRILVIVDGRIVEEGDHLTLMDRPDGVYRRLKVLQD
ncbi:MAG: ABC transporter ATP-binding protein [Planctomycetota bacterium]